MRIIAGTHRGIALTELGKGDAAAQLRPTSDRTRESLFNIITMGANSRPLEGRRVLDLFAGTGALGLEALSRGAERICFVESGRTGFKLISKNIAKLRAAENCTLLTHDATRLPTCPYNPFDVVFLDPPYGRNLGKPALEAALQNGWIASDALIIWEENSPQDAPTGFTQLDTRKYGETHITLLEPLSSGN
ncbi:MAG: 16S rRNA (guanine(966)-N(2))-methyltransferase RsmD [Litoreibacter sp.]